jgi:arginase family enzyme
MQLRILDLDGSLPAQEELVQRRPQVFALPGWGEQIRLACSFARFRRFEQALATSLGDERSAEPAITFYGSGDFHHVALALLRRLRTTVNLLVIDNHPDWMRGVPFLHCGTWLYHAARLPHVASVYHFGGHVDFDNYYQPLAPWAMLRAGKIRVFPATRRFARGGWRRVHSEPVRAHPEVPASADRIAQLLAPLAKEVGRRPLYISLDKDVMGADEGVVNWDWGRLNLAEVQALLQGVLHRAQGRVAGMDVVGDWSSVRLRGWLRHLMHHTMHPHLAVDGADAARRNGRTNASLLDTLEGALLEHSAR